MIRRLFSLSLRQKIPLWGTVLILVSTVSVSSVLIYRTYHDIRASLISSATGLGHTLARNLAPPLLHDDIWRAFEMVRAPLSEPGSTDAARPQVVLVVNPDGTVFVSSAPERFPILQALTAAHPEFELLAGEIVSSDPDLDMVFEPDGSKHYFVTVPIADRNRRLGTLVLVQSRSALNELFVSAAVEAGLLGCLILAVLLPMNWYWGRLTAGPLVTPAQRMDLMPEHTPDMLDTSFYPYQDELGQLFDAYNRMVGALREKKELERGVLAAERLAAVGRLTAGIAHEINNPLAGLLTAIDTLKTRDSLDPKSRHTLELIERGLHQIGDTVTALLAEARGEQRDMAARDVEDVATLLQPVAGKLGVEVVTEIDLPQTSPVPAGPFRQILINLVTNALQAAGPGGHVRVQVQQDAGALRLRVLNDGTKPSPEQLEHLFEPFVSYREGGHGLGLWVTYQLIEQLHGRIHVAVEDEHVEFLVDVPLDDEAVAA